MQTLVDAIIEKRAQLTPGRVALKVWNGQSYSYRELNERKNRLANHLVRSGVKKGDRIAVLARNGVCYVDIFFAAAKIGAIIAPFNWRLTAVELAYLAGDAAPSVLFFSAEFADVAAQLKRSAAIPRLEPLDEYEQTLGTADPSPPAPVERSPDDPHTIFYTSGTTGQPKGAVLPHRMIVWNSVNTIVSWGLCPDDVAPVFTPMFHSGGFNILLVPVFHVGGTAVLTEAFDPAEALRLIEQHRATAVFMVPTMFQMVADLPGFDAADLSSVRFCITGGAPCPHALIERYQKRGMVFKQGFGLTEAGVNAFTMTDEEAAQHIGAVGRPIFHSSMKIVDESNAEVPTGEVGELLIKGPHVCSGYWRNPEATEAAFADGWLKTGDLARRDPDGIYWIMGRKKEMIISGGENIYLAELELALAGHPKIKEAAVLGIPDLRWGEVGRAVVVLEPGQSATAEEIRTDLNKTLASFKVPKEVVFADTLPRTAYGKVIRQALRERYGQSCGE